MVGVLLIVTTMVGVVRTADAQRDATRTAFGRSRCSVDGSITQKLSTMDLVDVSGAPKGKKSGE